MSLVLAGNDIPLARTVYDRLAPSDEEQARALLKAQMHLHFGV